MVGMGAVIGPASGTATRPVSRADRPGAAAGSSSSGSTTGFARVRSAGAEGAAATAGVPAAGVLGRSADSGWSAGAVAVQKPVSGVSGAVGACCSTWSRHPSPSGVVGVNSSPATRGMGPVMSDELITGIRVVVSVMCSGSMTGSSPVAGSAEASSESPPRPG